MDYQSTRDHTLHVTSAQAIAGGISPEGGLYVPTAMPAITLQELESWKALSYQEVAKRVLAKFLTDFTPDELAGCIDSAYEDEKFSSEHAPLSKLDDLAYLLELWHGPTCAFKDMALQLLPHLMSTSIQKTGLDKEIVILVATSGDTGKAALEGFKNVKGTKILVFYPQNGVSDIQKLQMCTQEGQNVYVCAIQGNFDDAQSAVKAMFTDETVKQALKAKNQMFSSANSINWGRLVPQIVYYIWAYCDMLKNSEIKPGEAINIVVPTGNFGNILAAYYARKMGLPVHKLLCASNSNNVLTDFINTGVYDRNRDFYVTMSPSMDILISSNLERLIFDLSDGDDALVSRYMNSLKETGRYEVSASIREKMEQVFVGGWADEATTSQTIKEIFDTYSYLCDPHTAVAVAVYEQYKRASGDSTKTVIASTASPYKFADHVLASIDPAQKLTGFAAMEALEALSKTSAPAALKNLREKPVRFDKVVDKQNMAQAVLEIL